MIANWIGFKPKPSWNQSAADQVSSCDHCTLCTEYFQCTGERVKVITKRLKKKRRRKLAIESLTFINRKAKNRDRMKQFSNLNSIDPISIPMQPLIGLVFVRMSHCQAKSTCSQSLLYLNVSYIIYRNINYINLNLLILLNIVKLSKKKKYHRNLYYHIIATWLELVFILILFFFISLITKSYFNSVSHLSITDQFTK